MVPASPQTSTQISATVEVGSIASGKATGVEVGTVAGDVTVESTVNQIEAKIVQGDYVGRDQITNNILVLGPEGLEALLGRLKTMLKVDEEALKKSGPQPVPKNVGQQIGEVIAAQKQMAAQGALATPQSLYDLGMLAAYHREYEQALDYFRQATALDQEFFQAFKTIAWMQQSRAMDDFQGGNYPAAREKLAEALNATRQTDPLDLEALNLRGYIAKTLAQIAEALHDQENKQKYNQEAARLFHHIVQLDPDDPGAHNGLGNIEFALGNVDAAIAAYERAIDLAPTYTAAYHDLALALETKMARDPVYAADWRQKAIQAWKKTYELAPNDPAFSADYIVTIGQRIYKLGQQQEKLPSHKEGG
jgi:tetratricopeptide (TPR) repeat protein